jgi:hypothetical protein
LSVDAASSPSRRRLLALGIAGAVPGLAALAGCASPLPLGEGAAAAAAARDGDELLRASAEAHGLEAYRRLRDINVRYEGEWRPLIDRVQPVVVDKGYRGASEERLMPAAGVVAPAYTGTAGRKHVLWRRPREASAPDGDVAVWFDERPSTDPQVLDAAALVAEGYGLFLLGPLWLAGRGLASRRGGRERVDGRLCEVVDVWLRPGLGRTALDRATLCIDAAGVMHRVRFTLEGFATTRGAVAQVDTYDHERRFGVLWPMRSYEVVVHPLPLPAHDWRIAGLDVDRGYDPAALSGPAFSGAAARPASAI